MGNPLVLYSTNTRLAFYVAETFYRSAHFVYCSQYFSPAQAPPFAMPAPTSCPSEIYFSLEREVRGGDRQSAKVASNRLGLIKGAEVTFSKGLITQEQHDEIVHMAKNAQVAHFEPLLYIMPYAAVSSKLRRVPVEQRASLLFEEWIIDELPRALFDVISLAR